MIDGFFSDGRGSRRMPSTLQLAGGQATVLDAAGRALISAPLADTRISSRLASTPRSFRFAGGEQFVTSDNAAVDALLRQPDWRWGLLQRLESNYLAVIVCVAIVWGAAFLLARYCVPWAADQMARQMSPEMAARMGQGALRLTDGVLFRPSALPRERQLQLRKQLQGVLERYGGPAAKLHFRRFRRGPMPNAFALPDGSIVLTDTLVKLALHENEILAVVCHEIGHVQHRHLLRQSLRTSAFGALIFLATGEASAAIVSLPTVLVALSYRREFEREADQFAINALIAEGISPLHLASMLRRLGGLAPREAEDAARDSNEVPGKPRTPAASEGRFFRDLDATDYFSTHPDIHERILWIEAAAAAPAPELQ